MLCYNKWHLTSSQSQRLPIDSKQLGRWMNQCLVMLKLFSTSVWQHYCHYYYYPSSFTYYYYYFIVDGMLRHGISLLWLSNWLAVSIIIIARFFMPTTSASCCVCGSCYTFYAIILKIHFKLSEILPACCCTWLVIASTSAIDLHLNLPFLHIVIFIHI